jgi:hypothetical protein
LIGVIASGFSLWHCNAVGKLVAVIGMLLSLSGLIAVAYNIIFPSLVKNI